MDHCDYTGHCDGTESLARKVAAAGFALQAEFLDLSRRGSTGLRRARACQFHSSCYRSGSLTPTVLGGTVAHEAFFPGFHGALQYKVGPMEGSISVTMWEWHPDDAPHRHCLLSACAGNETIVFKYNHTGGGSRLSTSQQYSTRAHTDHGNPLRPFAIEVQSLEIPCGPSVTGPAEHVQQKEKESDGGPMHLWPSHAGWNHHAFVLGPHDTAWYINGIPIVVLNYALSISTERLLTVGNRPNLQGGDETRSICFYHISMYHGQLDARSVLSDFQGGLQNFTCDASANLRAEYAHDTVEMWATTPSASQVASSVPATPRLSLPGPSAVPVLVETLQQQTPWQEPQAVNPIFDALSSGSVYTSEGDAPEELGLPPKWTTFKLISEKASAEPAETFVRTSRQHTTNSDHQVVPVTFGCRSSGIPTALPQPPPEFHTLSHSSRSDSPISFNQASRHLMTNTLYSDDLQGACPANFDTLEFNGQHTFRKHESCNTPPQHPLQGLRLELNNSIPAQTRTHTTVHAINHASPITSIEPQIDCLNHVSEAVRHHSYPAKSSTGQFSTHQELHKIPIFQPCYTPHAHASNAIQHSSTLPERFATANQVSGFVPDQRRCEPCSCQDGLEGSATTDQELVQQDLDHRASCVEGGIERMTEQAAQTQQLQHALHEEVMLQTEAAKFRAAEMHLQRASESLEEHAIKSTELEAERDFWRKRSYTIEEEVREARAASNEETLSSQEHTGALRSELKSAASARRRLRKEVKVRDAVLAKAFTETERNASELEDVARWTTAQTILAAKRLQREILLSKETCRKFTAERHSLKPCSQELEPNASMSLRSSSNSNTTEVDRLRGEVDDLRRILEDALAPNKLAHQRACELSSVSWHPDIALSDGSAVPSMAELPATPFQNVDGKEACRARAEPHEADPLPGPRAPLSNAEIGRCHSKIDIGRSSAQRANIRAFKHNHPSASDMRQGLSDCSFDAAGPTSAQASLVLPPALPDFAAFRPLEPSSRSCSTSSRRCCNCNCHSAFLHGSNQVQLPSSMNDVADVNAIVIGCRQCAKKMVNTVGGLHVSSSAASAHQQDFEVGVLAHNAFYERWYTPQTQSMLRVK